MKQCRQSSLPLVTMREIAIVGPVHSPYATDSSLPTGFGCPLPTCYLFVTGPDSWQYRNSRHNCHLRRACGKYLLYQTVHKPYQGSLPLLDWFLMPYDRHPTPAPEGLRQRAIGPCRYRCPYGLNHQWQTLPPLSDRQAPEGHLLVPCSEGLLHKIAVLLKQYIRSRRWSIIEAIITVSFLFTNINWFTDIKVKTYEPAHHIVNCCLEFFNDIDGVVRNKIMCEFVCFIIHEFKFLLS